MNTEGLLAVKYYKFKKFNTYLAIFLMVLLKIGSEMIMGKWLLSQWSSKREWEGEGGMYGESSMETYALPCVK